MKPKKPSTVQWIELVITESLARSKRLEIVRNAKRPFSQKFVPQSIRLYWDRALYVYWDNRHSAWMLVDNFEEGERTLVYYPSRDQWCITRPQEHAEINVTHEEAEAIAHTMYPLTRFKQIYLASSHYDQASTTNNELNNTQGGNHEQA